MPCVPIFKENQQLWLFWPTLAQKWVLGSEFQKSRSRFAIYILEILYAAIFRQNGQLRIFGPRFAQNFGVKISKIKVWIQNQHPWDTMCTNFQTKQTTLNFWAQICPKMNFGVRISKNLSLDSKSTPPIYHECQFSIRMENLWFFQPKFGETAQLRAILWFKYCWGCCRELGGGGWS